MPSKKSAQQLKKLLVPVAAKVAAKPQQGSHEYLVQNPPRFITDPDIQEYWKRWAATTSHTSYGSAVPHFRAHAAAVVDGRKEPVR
jgi:hypothetical protein